MTVSNLLTGLKDMRNLSNGIHFHRSECLTPVDQKAWNKFVSIEYSSKVKKAERKQAQVDHLKEHLASGKGQGTPDNPFARVHRLNATTVLCIAEPAPSLAARRHLCDVISSSNHFHDAMADIHEAIDTTRDGEYLPRPDWWSE